MASPEESSFPVTQETGTRVTYSVVDNAIEKDEMISIRVEGPDGTNFIIDRIVPSLVTVAEVIRGVIEQYEDQEMPDWPSEPKKKSAGVADLVLSDESTLRLSPQASLKEADIQEGCFIRVSPDGLTAGSPLLDLLPHRGGNVPLAVQSLLDRASLLPALKAKLPAQNLQNRVLPPTWAVLNEAA